ncbi:MAG: aminopeptidase [Candidatus Lokiarchaeota archaeon]|nr:aminopeptidase [Candidatus Lokiarchaeota archaeon]
MASNKQMKEKIKQCAENIVKCVNVKTNDCVFVKGGTYCQDLLEEVALCVFRKGGLPHITSTSDDYSRQVYGDGDISIETLGKTHKHLLKMIENIDAYIVIEPMEDPSIQNDFPREKLQATSKASSPIYDVLYGSKKEFEPGKRWVYAGWPSKKAANYYNIDYSLYEQFIIDGMSVPPTELREITDQLGKLFQKAKNVRVTDDLGTNFWLSTENRRINYDAGVLTEEMISEGDLGGNLPAGEIFFAPIETMGEGTIFCPLTNDRYSGKILKNVELPFKNGRLLIDEVNADNNVEDLRASFKQSEDIDKTNENVSEIRTYNVAELGIGCNPKITKAIGYILTDEKINGSVHVAFGSNKMYGGTSVSRMHWDFVTDPRANIEIEYVNGDKKTIMKNGILTQ